MTECSWSSLQPDESENNNSDGDTDPNFLVENMGGNSSSVEVPGGGTEGYHVLRVCIINQCLLILSLSLIECFYRICVMAMTNVAKEALTPALFELIEARPGVQNEKVKLIERDDYNVIAINLIIERTCV